MLERIFCLFQCSRNIHAIIFDSLQLILSHTLPTGDPEWMTSFGTSQLVEPGNDPNVTESNRKSLAYYDYDAKCPYFYGPGLGWLRVDPKDPDNQSTWCKKATDDPYPNLEPTEGKGLNFNHTYCHGIAI